MKIRMSIEHSDDEKLINRVMEKYHFDKEAVHLQCTPTCMLPHVFPHVLAVPPNCLCHVLRS